MLFIVGKKDIPIYELNLGILDVDISHIHHFIAHSSLDIVNEVKLTTSDMYLRNVDKHGKYNIFAFLTGANFKFLLLLEDVKNENYIHNFFLELYKIFTKVLMNPLYDSTEKIKVPYFDFKVKKLIKSFLL